MRKLHIIAAVALAIAVSSCASSRRAESRIELPLRLEKAEYEIVGSFRKKTRNKFTYDMVLRDVRRTHGKNVDIVNLKIDKRRKMAVINGYVIRYKTDSAKAAR